MEPGPRKFAGFSVPDGAWIPPEVIYMLPRLTESQLKVLMVTIYNDLQTGGSEPTSLGTLETMTKLARSSIHTALSWLMEQGLIEKKMIGKVAVYTASVRISDTKLSKKESKLINKPLTDSLNLTMCPNFGQLSVEEGAEYPNSGQLSANSGQKSPNFGQLEYDKFALVSEIRTLGVYFQTARKIVEEFDEETIRRHIGYFEYALEKRMAGTAGWLVLSLREKWGPPLGYEEQEDFSEYVRS